MFNCGRGDLYFNQYNSSTNNLISIRDSVFTSLESTGGGFIWLNPQPVSSTTTNVELVNNSFTNMTGTCVIYSGDNYGNTLGNFYIVGNYFGTTNTQNNAQNLGALTIRNNFAANSVSLYMKDNISYNTTPANQDYNFSYFNSVSPLKIFGSNAQLLANNIGTFFSLPATATYVDTYP